MPKIKISEAGKKARTYNIKSTRELITIGRGEKNDIMLSDPSVSSKHCQLRRVEGGYILDDLDSTNGSKIDRKRFNKIDLDSDTKLKLGDVYVDFSFTDEEYDILDEEEKFVSEEEKKDAKKKRKKDAKRNSEDQPEDSEQSNESEIDEDEDEGSSSLTFLVTVIAFLVTIAVGLIVLKLTGNLSF